MAKQPLFLIDCELDQDRDDLSEITCPLREDEDLSKADDFGIKLAADPYFFYTLDARHPAKTDKQELIELKLQVARQQEKLGELLSKLNQAQNENEVLKAENAVLLVELQLSSKSEDQSTTKSEQGVASDDGAVQELLGTNAKLVTENARLQVVNNILRKSFKNYITNNRQESPVAKNKHVKASQQEQALQPSRSMLPRAKSFGDNGTAVTSLESSETTQDHALHLSTRSSVYSIPEGWTIDGVGVDAETKDSRVAMREATLSGRNTTSAARARADELLVDFGETRRPRGRRWSLMM